MNQNREKVEAISLELAGGLVLFVFLIISVAIISYVVHVPINFYHGIVCFILCFSILLFRNHKNPVFSIHHVTIIIAIWFAIILCSIVFSGIVYDFSYDGQSYQQQAIIELEKGWNPFDAELKTGSHLNHELWINSYPKTTWYYGVVLFKLTGNLESGKSVNTILFVASVLAVCATLMKVKQLRVFETVLFSLAIALNPVSIYQQFTFCVDGVLSSLMTTFVSLLCYCYLNKSKKSKLMVNTLCFQIFILLINTKFTGLIYGIIFSISAIVYGFCKQKKGEMIAVSLTSSTAFIVGFFIIGYNPYVTNMMRYNHVLYPLMGTQNNYIMYGNLPDDLIGKNRFEKLMISTFAEGTMTVDQQAELKVPFMVTKRELGNIWYQPYLGGFGPFWSGMIVLSVIIAVIILVNSYRDVSWIIWIMGTVFLSTAINPQCWWARLIPQLWIAIVIPALAVKIINGHNVGVLYKLLLFTTFVNIAILWGAISFRTFYGTYLTNDQLSQLNNKRINVHFGRFPSNKNKLDRYEIKYKEIQKMEAGVTYHKLFGGCCGQVSIQITEQRHD